MSFAIVCINFVFMIYLLYIFALDAFRDNDIGGKLEIARSSFVKRISIIKRKRQTLDESHANQEKGGEKSGRRKLDEKLEEVAAPASQSLRDELRSPELKREARV